MCESLFSPTKDAWNIKTIRILVVMSIMSKVTYLHFMNEYNLFDA